MTIQINRESPLQNDVRSMVGELNAYMIPLSPREFQFQLSVEEMDKEDISVFVARAIDGKAVGMGSLKIHDELIGEVKRMFTIPEVRGQGVGRLLVNAIEAQARADGLIRIVLETGATKGFEPAWRIYERCGYQQCAAVLDYPDSGYSRFYEKNLDD